MQQPTLSIYPMTDIVQWDMSGQLEIAPRFQRRAVWNQKARSYLIDTILRGMPMPPLFMRLRVDPGTRRTVREVVDGQQRLRAVLDFIRGEFPVMRIHNKEFGGMSYPDLPDGVQREFLRYKFVVHILEDISDAEVLGIFARLNTYTVRLNPQELRNAEFFGVFKQTVYELAHQHYAFWRNNRILRDSQIARMREAELVSILIVTMLEGIRETKIGELNGFYKRYDDDFAQGQEIASQFDEVLDIIGDIFGNELSGSLFRRVPLFYSLFVVLYDARFGLPRSERPRLRFPRAVNREVLERLRKVEVTMDSAGPPGDYTGFIEATSRSTADAGARRARHEFLWEKVLS